MSGRGEAGLARKEDKVAEWHRAGSYGIYDFSTRDVYHAEDGDYMEFENLEMVEVTIYF